MLGLRPGVCVRASLFALDLPWSSFPAAAVLLQQESVGTAFRPHLQHSTSRVQFPVP